MGTRYQHTSSGVRRAALVSHPEVSPTIYTKPLLLRPHNSFFFCAGRKKGAYIGSIGCIDKIGEHRHGTKKGGTKPPRLPISPISKWRSATALETTVVMDGIDITQPLFRFL